MRSRAADIPVGLHPNWGEISGPFRWLRHLSDRLTGTVYSALGLGFDAGQFSNIDLRDWEDMPLSSVATSRVDVGM